MRIRIELQTLKRDANYASPTPVWSLSFHVLAIRQVAVPQAFGLVNTLSINGWGDVDLRVMLCAGCRFSTRFYNDTSCHETSSTWGLYMEYPFLVLYVTPYINIYKYIFLKNIYIHMGIDDKDMYLHKRAAPHKEK